MKRKDIDWNIIRGALIYLVLTIIISSSLVVGSYYFKEAMKKEFNMHNALFMNISQRYLAIDEEEKQIKTYLPEFVALFNKGVIGEEQRLNWVEVLAEAEASVKLPSLAYTINSQRTYTPAFPVNFGKFQLYASEMSLQLVLLHEGDLLNLFENMNKRAHGIFTVNSCTFIKSGSIIMDNPKAANIAVDCNLDWYTIRLADGTEIKVEA